MAKILLIETATEVCGAAIALDGVVVAQHENPNSSEHAALLTPQIEACLRDSGIALRDLDAVAVSRGPGSYTSLRIGSSVAKGICYALEKPLIAVDTLQALAWASREALRQTNPDVLNAQHMFAPMIDARRQEVCFALFAADLSTVQASTPEILDNKMFLNRLAKHTGLTESERLSEKTEWFVLSGNGSQKTENVLEIPGSVFSAVKRCSVGYLAALAENRFQKSDFQSLAYFEPTYMKPPNITTPKPAMA